MAGARLALRAELALDPATADPPLSVPGAATNAKVAGAVVSALHQDLFSCCRGGGVHALPAHLLGPIQTTPFALAYPRLDRLGSKAQGAAKLQVRNLVAAGERVDVIGPHPENLGYGHSGEEAISLRTCAPDGLASARRTQPRSAVVAVSARLPRRVCFFNPSPKREGSEEVVVL